MSDALADAFLTAAAAAADSFGIEGTIELVSASENLTYRVTSSASSYVLRLHRPGYHTLDELNSERDWLAALGEASVAAPQPLPAPDGRYYVPVGIEGAETRFAGLSRWADGDIIGDVFDQRGDVAIDEHFEQLGSLMAMMHNQATGWEPPPRFTRHRLDADGLLGESPFWGPFWENPALSPAEQKLLRATRDRLHPTLEAYGYDRGTFSMIHADLHLGNLLVDNGELSLIDFDDAGFGWHQYDIAVAFYHTRDLPNFDEARRHFLDAYRLVRHISDDDLALVPTFELIRGLAIIGWKAQRPEVQWPDGLFDEIKDGVIAACMEFAT